jgi:uncharacterized low-complexity protein
MNNKMIKPVSLALGSAFVGGLALGNVAFAADGLQAIDLGQGYMLVDDHNMLEEGKCGADKRAGEKAKDKGKSVEGFCGAGKAKEEGKRSGEKATDEGKSVEGFCGAGKAKEGGKRGGENAKDEGKSVEGFCGAGKAKEEGRCGGAA